MGCCDSKPKARYEVREGAETSAATGRRAAETSSKGPKQRKQWPDGIDRHFNFKENIDSEWIIRPDILGRGAFGTVKKCHRVGSGPDGEVCAVKIIPKKKLEVKEDIEDLRLEVDCMKRLGMGSLNCIALYDAYEDDNSVYLIMELAAGGELYARIKQGKYTEIQAAQMAKSILQMVAQCHAKNIVYRDIKPNNFLFLNTELDSPLKATDFGLAVHHPPGSPPLRDTTGTPYYIAPEVIRQNYGFECDLWSAGALIYQLLCGKVPFPPDSSLSGRDLVFDLFKRILNSPIDLTSPPTWPVVSDNAKDLVRRLMERNIRERITISEALNHPWFQEFGAKNQPLDNDVVQRLQRYSTYGRFRQQAMVAALEKVKSGKRLHLPWSGDMDKLRKMFHEMDSDGNGELSYDEVKRGLREAKYALSDAEVAQLFQSVDIDGTGSLSPEEFLVAMLDWQKQQEAAVPKAIDDEDEEADSVWRDLFDKYDMNNDGFLSVDEIATIMRVDKDSPVIHDILRETDTDNSGTISFREFKVLMLGTQADELEIYSQRRMGAKSGASTDIAKG